MRFLAGMTSLVAVTTGVPTLKGVKRILPAPRPHWVGDGFNVYPVFADLAFTKEYAAHPWRICNLPVPASHSPCAAL
jgi:hypothetical protein